MTTTTTTTTATNQAPEGSDLETLFRRIFGDVREGPAYEYVRVPGLHLAAELDEVIEPGTEHLLWQAAETRDGRKLLAVYCRRDVESAPAPVRLPPVESTAVEPQPPRSKRRSGKRTR